MTAAERTDHKTLASVPPISNPAGLSDADEAGEVTSCRCSRRLELVINPPQGDRIMRVICCGA